MCPGTPSVVQTAPENYGAQDPARTAAAPVQGAAYPVLEDPSRRGPAASEETRLVSWEGAWHAEKEGRGGWLGFLRWEGEAGLER